MIITEQMFTVKGLDRADIGLSGSAFFCGPGIKIVANGNCLPVQARKRKTLRRLRVTSVGYSSRSKGCHSERSEETYSLVAGRDPSQAQGDKCWSFHPK